MSKREKNNTTLLIFYVDTRKKFESNMMQWLSFRGGVPYQNHHACCEKVKFVRSIYTNLPQMGQKLYHAILMMIHDSMPCFMNFRRFFYLLVFLNQVSQCLRPSDGGRVFDIHSHFLHGTKACTQGQRFDFSTNLYGPEHVHVVQI